MQQELSFYFHIMEEQSKAFSDNKFNFEVLFKGILD